MTNAERIAEMYASYSDEELVRQIAHEEGEKAQGYNPETLDLKKRGCNPQICDEIIGDMRAEQVRRSLDPTPKPPVKILFVCRLLGHWFKHRECRWCGVDISQTSGKGRILRYVKS